MLMLGANSVVHMMILTSMVILAKLLFFNHLRTFYTLLQDASLRKGKDYLYSSSDHAYA